MVEKAKSAPIPDMAGVFEDPRVGRLLPLTKGYWTIVDEDDYDRVSQFKWSAAEIRNSNRRNAYGVRNVFENGVLVDRVQLHNFIIDKIGVDHKNGNGLDNRKRNLRACTQHKNCMNRMKYLDYRGGITTSIYKGVSLSTGYAKAGKTKWLAKIKHNGKQIYIGVFDHEVEAARAYDRKARELFGEFAWLNFPDEVDDGGSGSPD